MVIREIQTGLISLPLRHPFKTALRTVTAVNDVVVRVITDDGQEGYGEAPPTAVITGDTIGSITCAVRDFIRPALLGMEIENLDGIMTRLSACMVKNTAAKAAVDMAIYDLYGKRWGAPLYQLLGGARCQFKTDLTISVNSADEMVSDSLEAVSRGYDILKIKVGKDAAADLARIAAIREAVGPKTVLRVDANQGWTPKQAVSIISTLEDRGLNIELVEQPVRAHDLDGMRYVTQRVRTPILADESVFSAGDALDLLSTGGADLINIKLMKTGGLWQALKICDIAELYGAHCMVGCMLESRLSVAAAAHLAAGRGVVTLADLDGPSLCAQDPYRGGPAFQESIIAMTDDPGIGVTGVPCTVWQ
ncbi:MAG: dipeptide epimerase [Intestinimonas sp.]|jgi:o-succinylbenzoate synthase|nr:dipeptide epimerase [Intestinimonas sp.]